MSVGIFSVPLTIKKTNRSYISKYVKWVELSGAAVTVIPYDLPAAEMKKALDAVKGLVLPGGAVENKRTHSDAQRAAYWRSMRFAFEYAKAVNDAGRYFPVFGICLGLETLFMLESGDPMLDEWPVAAFTNLTFSRNKTRMKAALPNVLTKHAKTTPCVQQNHQFGVKTRRLRRSMVAVSTEGEFVNMLEFKKYPFYAVMWHPEKHRGGLSKVLAEAYSRFLYNETQKKMKI
jgi:gamma-glutamyl hydrolase